MDSAEQYRVLFYVQNEALILVHGESRTGTMVLVEGIHKKAQKTPAGEWVEGYFFDDTKLKDKRPLNIADLDRVSA